MILRRPRRPWLLAAICAAFACEPTFPGLSAHACALLDDGSVWCWGYNSHGELGDGTRYDRFQPVAVAGLPPATSVSAGMGFTCAATSDGRALCWGRNDRGQLGDGTTGERLSPGPVAGLVAVRAVAVGRDAACAILEAGEVWCWGTQDDLARAAPVATVGLPAPALEVVVGRHASCALLSDGRVWCWGADGRARDASLPSSVALAQWKQDPCAVAGDGSVSCASGLPGPAIAIGGSDHQACAVLEGGAVHCWGDVPFGPPPRHDGEPFGPTPFAAGATAVAVGDGSACVRTASGGVACWGDNGSGQLGDGTDRARSSPVAVSGLPRPASAVTLSGGYVLWDYGCGFAAKPDEE